nr:17-beta-hydroxysteroid dehydrogenase 14-like [Rhipicephalus microplus]
MGSIESASLEDFKGVWEVNFCGALCMMKNAMPYLRQTKGNVVNVSSVAAITPIPCAVPYAVTKAALEHLSRCAALENAPYGVRVNAVRLALALSSGGGSSTPVLGFDVAIPDLRTDNTIFSAHDSIPALTSS